MLKVKFVLFVALIMLLTLVPAYATEESKAVRSISTAASGELYYADKYSVFSVVSGERIARSDMKIQRIQFDDDLLFLLVGQDTEGYFVSVAEDGSETYKSPALGFVSDFTTAFPYVYYIEHDQLSNLAVLKSLNVENNHIYTFDAIINPSAVTSSRDRVFVQSLAFDGGYNILSSIEVGSESVFTVATMPPFGELIADFENGNSCYVRNGSNLYSIEFQEDVVSISFITGKLDQLSLISSSSYGFHLLNPITMQVESIKNPRELHNKKKIKIAGFSANVSVTFLENTLELLERSNPDYCVEILSFENVEDLYGELAVKNDVDIVLTSNFEYKQLYFRELIQSFNESGLANELEKLNRFQEWFFKLCVIENEIYGLPFAYALPTVWSQHSHSITRQKNIGLENWMWGHVSKSRFSFAVSGMYNIDSTPPFISQKLHQLNRKNYVNFFNDEEFYAACVDWRNIIHAKSNTSQLILDQVDEEITQVTAFGNDIEGIAEMIPPPSFSHTASGVESLVIAVPRKASLDDARLLILEYYSLLSLLTDPIASKDLPILNEYEKYYDKNLT